MTKPNATYLTERSAYHLTLGYRTSSHTSVFVSMLLQAATILPDLVKPAPDWPAPPAKKKKKKKLKITVFFLFTPCPPHYHFTRIYTVFFICKTHMYFLCWLFYCAVSNPDRKVSNGSMIHERWTGKDLEKKEPSQDSRWRRWDMNQAVPKLKHNLMLLMSLCMWQGYELSLPVFKNYLESTWNNLKKFL